MIWALTVPKVPATVERRRMNRAIETSHGTPTDPNVYDVPQDDLSQQDRLRTRESKSFPWFGGMKIVHYYVMKDKE